MDRYVAIIGAIAIMMVSVSNVNAITNSTSNINRPLYQQIQNLIENPYFEPDASCMFDAYQLHCIPGDSQECPEGFGQNEDGTCFVSKRGGCPDGYHSADDDETGQCYPDTEPCWPGMIRYPSDRSPSEACGDTEDVCKKYNMSLPESCIVDGRSIVNFPTEMCLVNPDMERCALVQGYGCPTGFTVMTSANFTVPRCIPLNDEETLETEREREVFDPNRCTEGYELQVNANHIQVQTRGDNIGSCNKID